MCSVSIDVLLFTMCWIGTFKSVFPRMNVRDPYKRLGINREAGEEEVREARSYLASQVPRLPKTFVFCRLSCLYGLC